MKPLKVGLTGGIGSGKTTVANMFAAFDVPIYIADVEAKKLMVKSKVLIRQLKQLLGENCYVNGELNKPFIASKIFEDKALLKQINAIVHPKVARHFNRWFAKQNTPYVISESALIFENKTSKNYDVVISVIANKELRLQRVIQRDTSNTKKVEAIMRNQTTDELKAAHSDYVIVNEDLKSTESKVQELHNILIKRSKMAV